MRKICPHRRAHFPTIVFVSLFASSSIAVLLDAAQRDIPFGKAFELDSGNSADPSTALQLKHYHLTAFDDPQGYGRFAKDVYVNGGLTKLWSTCRDEPQVGTVATNCLVDSEYNDRLVFWFSFSAKEKWNFATPTIKDHTNHGDVAVENFVLDQAKEKGSFTVKYGCKSANDKKTRMFMMMKVPIMSNFTLKLLWGKVCRGGTNDNVRYGYILGDKAVEMTKDANGLEVSPLDMTTKFYFELKTGGYLQGFRRPTIESSDERVSAKVRGVGLGGTLSSEQRTYVTAIYECKGHAKAKIRMNLPIPPFSDIVLQWMKDCGGGLPKGLLIGTKAGASNVVKNGKTRSSFQSQVSNSEGTSEEQAQDKKKPSLMVIPAHTTSIEFFLKNQDLESIAPLRFDHAVITVSRPGVLAVRPSEISGSYFASKGRVLRGGESKTLNMRLVCFRAGQSIVTVTLPLLRYRNIEFSFAKQCVAPKIHEERFHWWNVKAVEDVVFLMVAIGVAFCCLVARKRSDPKYQRIRTRDA